MGRSRLSSIVFVVSLPLVVAACGSLAGNTVAQDLAYDRYKSCQYVTNNIFLNRIDADGTVRIEMRNGTAGLQEWQECMRNAAQAQATAKASAPPPRPIASGSDPTPPLTTATAPSPPPTPLPASIGVPTWTPGEEWAFRWETPSGKGTYVWSVDRKEKLDGVEHFVVKQGTLEMYYRVLDGVQTVTKQSGEVSRRYAPGWETVSFPLSVGKRWENRYTDERVTDRVTSEVLRTCLAEAEESVTVPAGTFAAVDIVCTNTRTGQIIYRMWYSPVVKQMVRRVWHVTGGIDERELIAYKVR